MELSPQLMAILGGGVALMILEKVFRFVKWILTWAGVWKPKEKEPVHIVNACTTPVEEEKLDRILNGLGEANKSLGTLTVNYAKLSTNVKNLAEHQRIANGASATLLREFHKTKEVCGERFATLEATTKK